MNTEFVFREACSGKIHVEPTESDAIMYLCGLLGFSSDKAIKPENYGQLRRWVEQNMLCEECLEEMENKEGE